jgi:Zn-dependent protease with chaperone function
VIEVEDVRRHRRAVLLFAALGYGYLFLLIVGLAGLTLWLATHGLPQLVILPALTLLLVLLSLIVRIGPPDGYRITREEAPGLFKLIDDTSAALESRGPDEVIINADINAGVAELPRFAFFGSRRWLILGLPLLHLLPEEELRAILAHEFAHLSRQHGRTSLLPIRLNITWENLATALQSSRSWRRFLFMPFLLWFRPRLLRRLQQLRRSHEFESDRLAARYAGAEALGRGLLRIAMVNEYARRVAMPGLFRKSIDSALPPTDAVGQISERLGGYSDYDDAIAVARMIMDDAALSQDSHPSFHDRVRAMNCSPVLSEPDSVLHTLRLDPSHATAARALLDSATVSRIETSLSQAWAAEYKDVWRYLHYAGRFAEDDGRTADEDFEAKWARAWWSKNCLPADAAIPVARAALSARPDSGSARVMLGRLLVEGFDDAAREEGRGLLEDALRDNARYALQAVEVLRRYYRRSGQSAELGRLETREAQLAHEVLRTLRERRSIESNAALKGRRLTRPQLEHVREVLQKHPEIVTAYLVQKRTRFLRDTPVYFLAFTTKIPWRRSFGPRLQQIYDAIVEDIVLNLGGDFILYPVEHRTAIETRLRTLPGAAIFPAGVPPTAGHDGWSKPPWWQLAFDGTLVVIVIITTAVIVGVMALLL